MIKCEKCGHECDESKLHIHFMPNVEMCNQNPKVLIKTTKAYVRCPICRYPIEVTSHTETFVLENRNRREYNMDAISKAIVKANEIYGSIEKFESNVPTLKIRYHRETNPELPNVEQHGNFYDVYCNETVMLNKGDFHLLDLGISVECPQGYWLQIVPRSSTYKNWGIIQANSFGVVDTSYCGDNDIIKMPILATKDIYIPANTRICQFRLVKDIDFGIVEVEHLDGPDRGGFGSTGQYEEDKNNG